MNSTHGFRGREVNDDSGFNKSEGIIGLPCIEIGRCRREDLVLDKLY